MADGKCDQCGASGTGMVCEYCGTLLRKLVDVDQEKKAIDTLARYIRDADRTKQSHLLRNGFLPEHEDAVIYAGLRCMPLIDTSSSHSEPTKGAVSRLKVVVAKLQLMPPSPNIHRAITQFEAVLKAHDRAEFRFLIWGLLFVLAVLGGLAWGGYYLFGK